MLKQSDVVSGSAHMHMFLSAQPVYSVGAFNPFTFKVIIDKYEPITVLIVWGLFSVLLFCLFVFSSCVYCLEKFL